MEVKLFGRSLFSLSKGGLLYESSINRAKESKFLMDFHKDTGQDTGGIVENWLAVTNTLAGATLIGPGVDAQVKKAKAKAKKPEPAKDEPKKLTPKEVHQLDMLRDESFKLNTDPKYVDAQLLDFKDKLALIQSEEYDMRRGVNEIASIIQRLENRKKYGDFKKTFDEFPYTTTSRINSVIKGNDHLKLGQVAQFMADMPAEATLAMKRYNEGTMKLCGKQAVFYIIADKKDFQRSDKRRDPILLAQSPYGHFWQILGAWDEEMMFLEQL